ncbi:hypothetical protein Pla175_35180 [Pirellulimonas nuda]|uniref:Flippase-like domain-containing protein n=1 Tax=Pirellulimonas nuda TaxID=2528009 RepID=A0A518DF82_9BACT|nr:lysylphosphatidylglycerol synthase transmembrane domain-containing protein [Pirellulimonas nuda]QDU90118.1 hypothetical protein Pla175_35180 [Pirellulimonas nuda]
MPSLSRTTRSRIVVAAKLTLGLGLIGALLWQAVRHEAFARISQQPKDWTLLGLALACCAVAVLISFLRWFCVARAGGVPLSVGEAGRLGALGFALNFVSLGSVGGDLFKAVFFARRHPGLRTAAVTTIVVDRALGLLILLIMCACGVLASGAAASQDAGVRIVAQLALGVGGVLTVAAALAFLPALSGPLAAAALRRIPLAGELAAEALIAWRAYRKRPGWLFGASVLTVAMHSLFTVSFYLIAAGLPLKHPGVADHFVIVPLALAAGGLLPLPNGLGSVEAVVELFYRALTGAIGDGTIVALTHRFAMLLLGAAAACFYVSNRAALVVDEDDAPTKAD